MYKQNGTPNFYIVTGYIDFRCGINSLCQKVKTIDPTIELTSNIAIVFMSRTKDKLKILYWEEMDFGYFHVSLKRVNING